MPISSLIRIGKKGVITETRLICPNLTYFATDFPNCPQTSFLLRFRTVALMERLLACDWLWRTDSGTWAEGWLGATPSGACWGLSFHYSLRTFFRSLRSLPLRSSNLPHLTSIVQLPISSASTNSVTGKIAAKIDLYIHKHKRRRKSRRKKQRKRESRCSRLHESYQDPFPEAKKKDPTVMEQKVRVLPAYFPTCDRSGSIFLTNPGST